MYLLDGASPAPHPVFFTLRRPNLAQTNNLFCSLLRPCAWLRHREVVTPSINKAKFTKLLEIAVVSISGQLVVQAFVSICRSQLLA